MKTLTLKKTVLLALPLVFSAVFAAAENLENDVAVQSKKFDGALISKQPIVQVDASFAKKGEVAPTVTIPAASKAGTVAPVITATKTTTPAKAEEKPPTLKDQLEKAQPWIVTGLVGGLMGFLLGGPIGAVIGAAAMMGFGYACREL